MDVVRHKLLCKRVGEDKKLTSKSKVDLACLPPCNSALRPHIQRVNHRVCLYKREDDPGVLEPLWSYGPVLSDSLVDLMRIMQRNRTKITNLILKISLKARVTMNREYDRA